MKWKVLLVNMVVNTLTNNTNNKTGNKKQKSFPFALPSALLVKHWLDSRVSDNVGTHNAYAQKFEEYCALLKSDTVYPSAQHIRFPPIAWENLRYSAAVTSLFHCVAVEIFSLARYRASKSELLSNSTKHKSLEPFTTLLSLVGSSGTVIVIPPKTHMRIPIEFVTTIVDNQLAFEHVYFIIGEQSHVTIVDTLTSEAVDAQAFLGRSVTCIIENDAQLNYIFLNYCDDKTIVVNSFDIIAKQNAQASIFYGIAGGAVTLLDANLECKGQASAIDSTIVYALAGTQQVALSTQQMHQAPMSTSRVRVKGIVRDNGFSNYDGNVTITQHAPYSSAHQDSAALLLSQLAKARATPALEVQTQEVQCSHGSAFGGIEKDQLYYLQARGISFERAQKMIVEGFFAPLFEEVNASITNTRENTHVNAHDVGCSTNILDADTVSLDGRSSRSLYAKSTLSPLTKLQRQCYG